jgi:UDP-2,4-diacetamido-2,4,6-trideoxy-beta-L-altropyranose hydrolase
VRMQSVNTLPIALQEHQEWFAAKLAAPDSRLFVLLAEDLPVGQIRFDVEGEVARIGYSVDRLFRGRGWARALVTLGMQAFDERVVFRAEVKAGNPASAAVFARMGFTESSAKSVRGIRTFTLDTRGVRTAMD